MPESMNKEARGKIENWLKGYKWHLLHFWSNIDEYTCVVAMRGYLHFLRVFKIGDEWDLSRDNRVSMFDPDTETLVDGQQMYYVEECVK